MLTVNNWRTSQPLGTAIDEWAVEAWERMTYGGVGTHNYIPAPVRMWLGKRYWNMEYGAMIMPTLRRTASGIQRLQVIDVAR